MKTILSLFLLMVSGAATAQSANMTQVRVQLDGVPVGYYSLVEGMGSKNDVIEHKIIQGGVEKIRLVPDETTYKNIVLEAVVNKAHVMTDWRRQVLEGRMPQLFKTLKLDIYSLETDRTILQWQGLDAWPAKYQQYLTQDGTLMERITLVYSSATYSMP